MGWSDADPFTNVTIPSDAGVGERRMVIDSVMPALLVSNIGAKSGIIFYDGSDADDGSYYFIVNSEFSATQNWMYQGYVREGAVLITQQELVTPVVGNDETSTALYADIINIGIGGNNSEINIGNNPSIITAYGLWSFVTAEPSFINDDATDVDVTPAAGWDLTGGYITIRRTHKMVYLRWQMNRTGANIAANIASTLATLAVKYRPASDISIAGGQISTGGYARFRLTSAGVFDVKDHAGITTNQDIAGSAMWMVA